MMCKRRSGFTLIELLVVIAIIAILAGMLFPVFARARESARKIQCLSNVKNIAMAFQIYLTDFDAFPSYEHDQRVLNYWEDQGSDVSPGCCPSPTESNPYLKVPVILDEYVKNRDVWRCPSARVEMNEITGMPINPCVPDWWTAFQKSAQNDGCRVSGGSAWPPGWGGSVTDTNAQGDCAFGGAFSQNYGWSWQSRGVKLSKLGDVAKYVVVAEAGFGAEAQTTTQWALPDLNKIDSVASSCGRGNGHCQGMDGCDCCTGYGPLCSQPSMCNGGDGKISLDPGYRKTFARHLGGNNMGFADGHAQWMDEEVILFGGHDHSQFGMHPQVYYGADVCFNASTHERVCETGGRCNDPTAGDF